MAKYTATFGLRLLYNTPGCSCTARQERLEFRKTLSSIKFGPGVLREIGAILLSEGSCLSFLAGLHFPDKLF